MVFNVGRWVEQDWVSWLVCSQCFAVLFLCLSPHVTSSVTAWQIALRVCVCVCEGVCMGTWLGWGHLCHSEPREVRGQLYGVSSVLPPLCGLWGLELGLPSFHSKICCCWAVSQPQLAFEIVLCLSTVRPLLQAGIFWGPYFSRSLYVSHALIRSIVYLILLSPPRTFLTPGILSIYSLFIFWISSWGCVLYIILSGMLVFQSWPCSQLQIQSLPRPDHLALAWIWPPLALTPSAALVLPALPSRTILLCGSCPSFGDRRKW